MVGVELRKVQEQVAVHIGGGQKDLPKLYFAARLRVGRDALQRAQQAAIAHAVGDHMQFFRAAVGGEIHQKIGDGAFTGLDGGLVRRVGRHAGARGPTEKRRGAGHGKVYADLRRADCGFFKAHIEAMQEKHRVGLGSISFGDLHGLLNFAQPAVSLLGGDFLQPERVIAQVQAQQLFPKWRADLSQPMRLWYPHFRFAKRCLAVALGAKAALAVGLAVGAEPHRVNQRFLDGEADGALCVPEVFGFPVGVDSGLLQLGQQLAHLALNGRLFVAFCHQALLNLPRKIERLRAVTGAHGGLELVQEFGERLHGVPNAAWRALFRKLSTSACNSSKSTWRWRNHCASGSKAGSAKSWATRGTASSVSAARARRKRVA